MGVQFQRAALVALCLVGTMAVQATAENTKSKAELSQVNVCNRYEAIETALSKSAQFEFAETPLGDVVQHLEHLLAVPIVIDETGLADYGLSGETPVTIKIKGVSNRAALRLILRPLGLDFTLRDECVWISTTEKVGAVKIVRLYDVTTLVQRSGNEDALVTLLTETVEPDSWNETGGRGSICRYSSDFQSIFVVSQSYKVHEKIANFLYQLSATQKEAEKASTVKNQPKQSALERISNASRATQN